MRSTRKNYPDTGSQTRRDADFNALQHNMSRLNSAGNHRVDWLRVEQHCCLLLSANTNDLQSHVRYTLARTHLAGLNGLCEGLEKITDLFQHHWETIIPLSVNARMTLLTWLSVQLQAALLKIRPAVSNLPLLYQTEARLVKIEEVLGVHTLKHLIQLSRLKVQVSQLINAIKGVAEADRGRTGIKPDDKRQPDSGEAAACWLPEKPGLQDRATTRWQQRRAFVSGMLAMAIIGGAGLAGNYIVAPERSRTQHIAKIAAQLVPGKQHALAYAQSASAGYGNQAYSQQEATGYIDDLLGELEKSPSSYALRVRVDYK